MKKFLLAFLAVFGLCFITYTPVHATSIAIPFSDVPALYYSFGTIAAGGSINLEDYDNPQDYIADLNRLLRGQEIQNNAYGMTQTTSITLFNKLASLALNGVSELTADGTLVIPYSNKDTAQYMGYNKYWYKYNIASGDAPVLPTPDPNYTSVLNTINGTGFWSTATVSYNNFSNYDPVFPILDISTPSYVVNVNQLSDANYSITEQLRYNMYVFCMPLPSLTFDINGSGDSYTLSLRNTLSYPYNETNDANMFNTFCYYPDVNILKDNGAVNSYTFYNSYIYNSNSFNKSGTLSSLLNWLSMKTRNINIYVNGELWALAGDIPVDNPAILAPDVIGVGDLPDDTYGVLGLNEPANLDLGAFLGWLEDMFDLGKDVIGLGDLVEEGDLPFLRTRDTDTDIDLDDTYVIPAEQVIDDPKEKEEEDEDTDPDPDPDPDPPFPAPLPPILPIPDPNFTPRQTTVLSEIIKATDTVVPDELMTLIWSTFGLLVVGGLIYILHK